MRAVLAWPGPGLEDPELREPVLAAFQPSADHASRLEAFAVEPPVFRDFFTYWLSRRRGRTLPGRADLDPLEMAPWLGDLMLVRLDPEPYFSLYGTKVAQSARRDLTHRRITELHPDMQAIFREIRAGCAEARMPLWVNGRQLIDDRYIQWRRLYLPLASDGERVDQLIAMARLDR